MSDKIIWVCCIALLAVGFIFGFNVASGEGLKIGIISTLNIFASIATIAAAFFAAYTLNSWKKQQKFEARFNAFTQLEQSAYEGFWQLGLYLSLVDNSMKADGGRCDVFLNIADEHKVAATKAIFDYKRNLYLAQSFLHDEETLPIILNDGDIQVFIISSLIEIQRLCTPGLEDLTKIDTLATSIKNRSESVCSEIRKLRDK
ncbi:hypothetical protein NTE05_004470 [Vibrio harveyi]|nr:hypothetical protein [Vibrio harveyi]